MRKRERREGEIAVRDRDNVEIKGLLNTCSEITSCVLIEVR